jgi:hypothetical protein
MVYIIPRIGKEELANALGKWHGDHVFVSEVLVHEPVGLKQIGREQWEVRYSFHLLGILDQQAKKIMPAQTWHRTDLKTA